MRGTLDVDRLWSDAAYRREAAVAHRGAFVDLLEARFALVPRAYVDHYLDHVVFEGHIENPLFERYVEAEFGAPSKYLAFIEGLEAQGYPIKGRRCLDIGCGNGALPLACVALGARDALGVDVSEGRLESAARLCEGRDVRLRRHDVVETPLDETFDAIFCTDVLEHVVDAEAVIAEIARSLSDVPKAYAYVSVFNRNTMENVLEEPHHSVPGLIRLPWPEAARIWSSLQAGRGSRIEYGIFDWHDFSELEEMAGRHGLRAEACYPEADQLEGRASEMARYREVADAFEERFAKASAAFPFEPEDRAMIERAVADYVRSFRQDHADRERAPDDPEVTKALFLKYYAQPLAAILRPIESPEPVYSAREPELRLLERMRRKLVPFPLVYRAARAIYRTILRIAGLERRE